MALAFTVLLILLLLVCNELWWRKHTMHSELSRKFIHVTVGSFVAFWPFILSWRQIQLLSVAFLIGVGISKYLNIFKAIHSVTRPTWGEIFFAISVGVITLITHNKGIYAAALLQMSLADGMAAIVGTRYGNKQKYTIFGSTKSVIGTLTFFTFSLIVLLGFSYYSNTSISLLWAVGIASTASLIENVAIRGMDNLLVPVVVALLLTHY